MADQNQKRRRVSRGQSKHGCYACRTRRVKCDETKPQCLKCQKLNKPCPGYPDPFMTVLPHVESSKPNKSGSPKFKTGFDNVENKSPPRPNNQQMVISPNPERLSTPGIVSRTPDQERLAQLGLFLLGPSITKIKSTIGAVKIRPLVLNFNNTFPVVHAALATVGSFYALQAGYDIDLPSVQKQYSRALGLQRAHLTNATGPQAPAGIACILLATAELLVRRRQNALVHLQAAFSFFGLTEGMNHRTRRKSLTDGHENKSLPENELMDLLNDDLNIFLYASDIQAALYLDGSRRPILPPLGWSPPSTTPEHNAGAMSRSLVAIVHSACHFVAFCAGYPTLQGVTPEMIIEQNRFIAALRKWQGVFDLQLRHLDAKRAVIGMFELQRARATLHRNTCEAFIIMLSTLFSTDEMKWDVYHVEFCRIADTAERVLHAMEASTRDMRKGFYLGIGLINPLALVAAKCRDSRLRHRAIHCLRLCSREGPWTGTVAAAITCRAAEIEETGTFDIMHIDDGKSSFSSLSRHSSTASDYTPIISVPRQHRITFIRMVDDDAPISDGICPPADEGTFAVRYLRRHEETAEGGNPLWTERLETLRFWPKSPLEVLSVSLISYPNGVRQVPLM